jgi:hypothetical protein
MPRLIFQLVERVDLQLDSRQPNSDGTRSVTGLNAGT